MGLVLRTGPLAFLGNAEDGGQLARKVDTQLSPLGRQHQRIDERADHLHRLRALFSISKRLLQRRDLLPVELGEVGVEQGLRFRRSRDLPLQLLLALLERDELVFEAPGRHAFGDRLDDAADALARRIELPLSCSALMFSVPRSRLTFATNSSAKVLNSAGSMSRVFSPSSTISSIWSRRMLSL